LQQLDCSKTQVSDLAPLLPFIKKGIRITLKGYASGNDFDFKDCPLTNPPVEIVRQGNEAILNYWAGQEKRGKTKIKEAKLLVLGEGGVGKTTLAEKIKNGYNRPMPVESTHGIEILQHEFECSGKGNGMFKTNIWDFGGQEIYHATHQFFLTKRSLYLLVDDARKEDTRFDYWLQIVELLSESSPVIIVQNCKAGRRRELDEAGLRGRFPNIKEVFYLDLSKQEDEPEFDKLLKEIEHQLEKLPHTNDTWLNNWLAVRQELEAARPQKRFISYERYEEVCAKHDLSEFDSRSLGQYLHDLGAVLHFHDDPVLRRTLFLDNSWIVNGVYEVLDDASIRQGQGQFSREDAAKVWEKGEYRKLHDDLLQLMMKFELCYELTEQRGHYLVPHLLPASTPALNWDEKGNLQLYYRYAFMPKGLLSRLIVRLHRFVTDTDKAWRTGVVFEREGAFARVVETYGEKYIRMHASGARAKELVTVVSDEIDRLNNGYHRLKVEKMVPCICPTCTRLDVPNFYDYRDLMTRKERGKRSIECRNSYDDVEVLRLLDHVFVTTFFTPKPLSVFVSYSKKDKSYLESLKKHLVPLRRDESLVTWDDTQILPGEEWDSSIRQQLATSDIIVLLVSSDFMATEYIWQEIGIAIERHERGAALVVPVIVRPCDWSDTPFAKFSALPEKGKPITKWDDQDEAWTFVVRQIKELSKKLRN